MIKWFNNYQEYKWKLYFTWLFKYIWYPKIICPGKIDIKGNCIHDFIPSSVCHLGLLCTFCGWIKFKGIKPFFIKGNIKEVIEKHIKSRGDIL